MAPRRKLSKLLTCFYCGRRSTTRYDGHIQQFECEKCNATNYLDSNGEITDPPVATTAIPDAPTYVRRGSSTPPPSDQVFCKKCLNNQHLFISSLAQYFPDDPNDPEYAERERNYYKFRRGLEKRYPQVCADCEPKVHAKLDKAAYTAKTDHLRRMLDRSAQTRVLLSTTPGHYWHHTGRWLWILSFVLQILWHVLLVKDNVLADDETIEAKSWVILAARTLDRLADYLPWPSRIVFWSFWTSVLSVWWNPRWVETYNGFTKHIVGRRSFYSYQILILVLKLAAWRNLYVLPAASVSRVTVHVVGHTFMAIFIYFLYTKAYRSVRTDHTPLWRPAPRDFGATQTLSSPEQSAGTRAGAEQSMADILDEILNGDLAQPVVEPSPYVSKFNHVDEFDQMPDSSRRRLFEPSTASSTPNPFNSKGNIHSLSSTSKSYGLGGLSLSDRPGPRTRAQVRNSQQLQYEMEMDWAPTQSQHRAFNTPKPNPSRALKFNETPVNEKSGVFWAKVPPAPTTPAQRIFNPPNLPMIRTSPATTTTPTNNTFQFQGSKLSSSFGPTATSPNGETTFANPTFFPKQPRDERDVLSGLFDASLAISPTRAVRPEAGQAPQSSPQEQTFRSKVLYLSLGLGIAIVGNWAYNYLLQSAGSLPALSSFISH